MGNNDFELEAPLEMAMKKKKSRSIDMFGGKNKSLNHHNSSVSSMKVHLKKNATSEDKK